MDTEVELKVLVSMMSAPGFQIGGVNLADNRRLGQHQQIVVALEIARPVAEPLAAIIRLLQPIALNHGAHRAIQNQNAAGQQVL
jgi:hypothetical protein